MAQQMAVRVLYTINNSSQYMLARTLNSAPVSLIYSATPSIAYGKTFLELCIQAINRASPELFNDEEEDYSLYLLDPLEAQQTTSALASSTTGARPQFTGVAVGLGLFSALSVPSSSQEAVFVTGTVLTGPDKVESLEVVFNLREMKRRSKPAPKQTKKRTTSKKQAASSSHPRTHISSSQVGLYPSTATNVQDRRRYYPNKEELYMNLPTSSDHYARPHHYQRSNSLQHLPGTSQLPTSSQETTSTQCIPSPSCSTTSSQPAQMDIAHSSQTSLQTILSVLSSADNADAVLSVLSLIDASKASNSQPTQQATEQHNQESTSSSSSQESPTDPAFVEALKNLLTAAASRSISRGTSTVPHNSVASTDLPTPSSVENTPSPMPVDQSLSTSPRHSKEPSNDLAVQVNKENVDPIRSSKSFENFGGEGKQRYNGHNGASGSSVLGSSPISGSGGNKKRPLSDIMDEKEQQSADTRIIMPWGSSIGALSDGVGEQSWQKPDGAIDMEQVKRRLSYLSSQTQSDPSYGWNPSYCSSRSSTWATAKVKNARSVAHSGLATTTTNEAGTKKRFVVPDWAKTETATVPRMSTAAAAAANAKTAEVEQKSASTKEKGSKGKKRKLAQTTAQEHSGENADHEESSAMMVDKPSTPKKIKTARADLSDFPIVASSSPGIFNSSPLGRHFGSSTMVLHTKTPKTPTRKRRSSSPSRTPRRSATRAVSLSPLFTPGSASCTTPKLPSLLDTCSPSFGSRGRSSPPDIIMSSKAAKKDWLVHLLPGASSDTENGSPMKVFSSSPPPSSPILTSSDDEHLQVVTVDASNSQDVDGVATKFMQDFDWLTNTTPCSTSQPFNDFETSGIMGFVHGNLEDPMSDFDETKFADEVFDWSSADAAGDSSDEFQFNEFWNSVKPLMQESSGDDDVGNVEGSKLASEMVDLFGGCLV